MKILVISYRDMEHPEAGGAEVIIFEIMKRLSAAGHSITLLTGGFKGGAAEARYAHLSPGERQTVAEILRDTLTDLPTDLARGPRSVH